MYKTENNKIYICDIGDVIENPQLTACEWREPTNKDYQLLLVEKKQADIKIKKRENDIKKLLEANSLKCKENEELILYIIRNTRAFINNRW